MPALAPRLGRVPAHPLLFPWWLAIAYFPARCYVELVCLFSSSFARLVPRESGMSNDQYFFFFPLDVSPKRRTWIFPFEKFNSEWCKSSYIYHLSSICHWSMTNFTLLKALSVKDRDDFYWQSVELDRIRVVYSRKQGITTCPFQIRFSTRGKGLRKFSGAGLRDCEESLG